MRSEIKTIGNKYSAIQTLTFKSNAQPMYFLLENISPSNYDGTISPDSIRLLTYPAAYNFAMSYNDEGKSKYVEYLECGLDAFKSINDK